MGFENAYLTDLSRATRKPRLKSLSGACISRRPTEARRRPAPHFATMLSLASPFPFE